SISECSMAKRHLYMTKNDVDRLDHLLLALVAQAPDPEALEALQSELDHARLVSSEAVPPDVVTMNSKVRVRDLESGEERIVTLVFPEHADPAVGKVSVLDPVGTAILGYQVNDEIQWTGSKTKLRLRIEEMLYQPEASGDRHL
ncbi:MAG: nucleoside diphosphate kinase regulator, partial [Phycisphaerae bacterium]|nr:nucleoside diphosphate kinase regulator [Phycisphaerae bacterium]